MSFPTLDQSLPWTIECWKARFQEFDSFSWFRATTDRALESSFSRVRFVYLVQGNDWSNVGKLVFKSSIRFLGSGQRLIECWKAHFQEFDSFPWFRARTDRMLESSFSRVRFVFLVQGNNWSNVGKLFQEFDSFTWFRARTEVKESNSWKWAFQHSISRCPEPSKRIELLKMSFPTFDQSLPWTKKTNRTLENELSNIRSVVALNHRMLESSFSRVQFVYLVQGNDWSNVGKLVFKSSIRFLGSGQRLIERWKAHFQEFNSFTWFRATTDRMLESSFSRVRFVFLVQGNDWSNVGKLFSRVRFVFLVQGNDWSNVGKLVFKSSIRFLGSGQGLIECWKARFQEFDSFSRFRATTDRMLESSFQEFDSFSWFRARTDRAMESSFSRVQFVYLVQGNDWSNVGKLFSRVRFVFLVQGNDWSNVGKLVFKSSIRFLGSGQRLIECWKAHFQEFDSFSWFRATTDRMLESWFSRVRFVFLVQGKDWSNVGKLIFKSSIRFLGSGQRLIECWKARFQEFDSFSCSGQGLIECWKAHFQEFDSFSWFRATTDRVLESSFSRVRFVFLVQGNDWSNVGKLVFKSSIRFLGSGQRLIERWKAHFQEFNSFTWFRATTDRMLESSFSRVRFVFLVQGKDWSNVGKLVFKSSIHLLGSGQRLIERWKAHFQEFDSFSWFRATTDRMLESSFSRVRFLDLVQGNDWSNVGKLISRVQFVYLVQGNDWSKGIELLKMSFPTFDQSLPWTK